MDVFRKTVFNDLKVALVMSRLMSKATSEDFACNYFMKCENETSHVSTLIHYFMDYVIVNMCS